MEKDKLVVLGHAKDMVLHEFDDGEITTRELIAALEKLQSEELDVMLELKKSSGLSHWKIKGVMVGLFIAGFFISPMFYPKIFGFSSAEECVLASKHKWAVGACYDLYPPLKQP